jgi:N-methylhydantoinase B
MTMLDGVTLEILGTKMAAAVDEMAITLQRTGRTLYVKETADFSTALATPEGRFYAYPHGIGVSCFVALDLAPVLAQFSDLQPGDVICTNHPYASGGVASHTPDLQLIEPYFHGGTLVGYGWAFVHVSDIGGRVPSSISPSSTELYQEGFLIPPLRLMRGGAFVPEVLQLFRANVRTPVENVGDLHAMLSALAIGRRRVGGMIERFGLPMFLQAQRAVIAQSRAKAHAVLARIPDGDYDFWDYLDDDATTGIPIRLRVTMRCRAGHVMLDYRGSDPQTSAPYNLPTAGRAHPFATLRFASFIWSQDPTIALNAGMLAAIDVDCEPGSVLNPTFPAPTGIRHATAQRLCDVVNGALAQAAPQWITAPSGGVLIPLVFAEPRPDGSRNVLVVEPMVGGMGAFEGRDGVDGRDGSFANLANNPIESVEAAGNLRVVHFGLRPDSGGPGRWRGGVGLTLSVQVCGEKGWILGRGMERFRFVPWGLQGGRAGQPARAFVNKGRADAREVGKIDMLELQHGDVFTIETPGGGGYGDAFLRDPQQVLRDVHRGLVSNEAAAADYGVVIARGRIDLAATERLRRERPAASAGAFDVGAERQAWERLFPDAAMAQINARLRERPVAERAALRERLIWERLPGVAQGASLEALARQHARNELPELAK